MKKNFFAVATRAALTVVSVLFVANLTSCSGPLAAGEDLDQISVKAEKPVIDVENFSAVEAEQISNLVFTTSDGNKLTATVIGVSPREVRLQPGAETADSRTINVELVGVNDDGVQRIARTSYQQRKASANEPAPEPTVIDIRLEADTTMTFTRNSVNSNRALMVINPIRRITTYSDGNEVSEEITQIDGLDVFICGDHDLCHWISNSTNPMESVLWNGTTTEQVEETTYDVRGFEVSERKEYIRCNISAISDVNKECSVAPQFVLITRNVKYTDAESGKSIEWKVTGKLEFAGREAIDEGREPYVKGGTYEYVGSHVVRLTNICNGYAFAETVCTTATYNK